MRGLAGERDLRGAGRELAWELGEPDRAPAGSESLSPSALKQGAGSVLTPQQECSGDKASGT